MEYVATNKNNQAIGLVDVEDYDLIMDCSINLNSEGYARKGSKKLHRIIIERKLGITIPPNEMVDHINSNRLDNRRINLRLCRVAENNRNMRKTRGLSKYKGVHWSKGRNKWYAQIKVNGEVKYLGLFVNEQQAAKKYNEAARIYHGDFAHLNKI